MREALAADGESTAFTNARHLGVFGDYELLEELGHGGMGVVYRARQRSLHREVALKMLLGGQFAGKVALGRFRSEAELAAQLQHPNIVAIHEIGEQDGLPYFTMDFVSGRSLVDLVRDQPLPARSAAAYVETIAKAIHYAHQQGVLHRDLKPSNVLIDAFDQPRITDFGLAKRLSGSTSDLTVSGQALGSPNFMPPEQAAGKHKTSGPTSDIYGLGAILYYLLTTRPPFMAEDASAAVRQVLENDPVSPRTLNPSVPRDLETLCLKCLQKEPKQRYASAQAVADELGRFLRGEPIQARPVSVATHFWRWCRRKPQIAGLSLALVIFGASGLWGVLSQWQRAEKMVMEEARQRDRADETAQHAKRLLYASDMNLAQQALKMNNLGRARRLLDRHRPQPGEEDLRGWEWRYLWQLTRSSALVTLTNRPMRGYSVSFSPNGSLLAVGWYNGRVDLWNVPGRRLIRALTDRDQPYQGRVAFSPVRNLLAATSEPRVVTLYDLDSGRESILWRAPTLGAGDVRDLAFSQDGSRVVIYAGSARSTPEFADAVWVVNASSAEIESRHPTIYSYNPEIGAARLSPDNRRVYLARSDRPNYRYNIQCLDLVTGAELWQTERQRDLGLSTLAISPDGRVLASGSGYEDPTIHVWEAATGRLIAQLAGHAGWVTKLVFTKDGQHLLSASSDQTIRFWDTRTWTETSVLRGHNDEVQGVAISETAQLVASASKDGDLMLWQEDGKSATDGYRRLPEYLRFDQVLSLDHSRLLLLPPGHAPELLDLKLASAPQPLFEIGFSTNVLGWFITNILCHWDGTNQIQVRELCGSAFIQRGAVSLDSGAHPTGFAYNTTRQLVAWTEGTSPNSVYLKSLATPGCRMELKSDVPGLVPFRFSGDGKYLAAAIKGRDSLRAWNVETGQIVASSGGIIRDAAFAAGDRVLVVVIEPVTDHEIRFYDLSHTDQSPRRVPGRHSPSSLSVSPDGGLVALSTVGGLLRLFEPLTGELSSDLHAHLNGAFGIAFSPDGRRLISAGGGREAVKLWDVGTRQELLTLAGTGSLLVATTWSADGDAILAGPPWQAWVAPSWEEIAAAEAQMTNAVTSR